MERTELETLPAEVSPAPPSSPPLPSGGPPGTHEVSDAAAAEANAWPPATKWIIGALAVVVIGLTSILSVGLAAIVWVPLLLGAGVALLMVWSARRRRQRMQNRGPDEVRDPTRAGSPWPTKGVIDDRLPEH